MWLELWHSCTHSSLCNYSCNAPHGKCNAATLNLIIALSFAIKSSWVAIMGSGPFHSNIHFIHFNFFFSVTFLVSLVFLISPPSIDHILFVRTINDRISSRFANLDSGFKDLSRN